MNAAKRATDVTSEPVPEPKDVGTSRIGLISASSNTTMEAELPGSFRRQSGATGPLDTIHPALTPLTNVYPEELLAMVGKASGCPTTESAAVAMAAVTTGTQVRKSRGHRSAVTGAGNRLSGPVISPTSSRV